MINDIEGIKIEGANFIKETSLVLFDVNKKKKERLSLIYGKNGSGKSTIARAFEIIKGKHKDSTISSCLMLDNHKQFKPEIDGNKICVFNEDFINENIRIREDGLDTIVVLGKQKEIEDDLIKANKMLNDLNESWKTQRKKCDEYEDNKNIVSPLYHKDAMLGALKGNGNWADRDAKIKGNKQASSVRSDTYKGFINLSPSKTREELVIEFDRKYNEYEQKKLGTTIIAEKIETNYQASVNEQIILDLLSEKIEEPSFSERERTLLRIAEEKGQAYYKEAKEYFEETGHDVCPYCLRPIDTTDKENLFNSIEKVLNKESDEHRKKLTDCKLDLITVSLDAFSNLDEEKLEKCRKGIDAVNKEIERVNCLLEQKQNNVYRPIILDDLSLSKKISDMNNALIELENSRITYNKAAEDVTGILETLKKINDEIAYYDIKDAYKKYEVQLSKKGEIDRQSSELQKSIEIANERVKSLEAEKRDVLIAVDVINDGLKYIFFTNNRLSIKYDKGKYLLLSHGKAVLPKDISVGERNAIALCYFFTSIMQNKVKENAYKEEHLIVIDDPISSFDIENRIGILSYLKYQLLRYYCGNADTKCIIMTHDMQTFYNIKILANEVINDSNLRFNIKASVGCYELKNELVDIFKDRDSNEYTCLLENVYDYAQEKNKDYSLVIGNTMRRVLEAFSTFFYKKGIADISTDSNILNKLEFPYDRYFENLMYRIVLNGGSHSREQIESTININFFDCISDDEKQRTARDVLCFMYLMNKSHLLCHLQNREKVQEQLDDWCNKINDSFGNE